MGNDQARPEPPPPVERRHSRADRYTEAEKARALALVGTMSYRDIAKLIDPHCSPGTIARWVKEHRRNQEALRLRQEAQHRERLAARERELEIRRNMVERAPQQDDPLVGEAAENQNPVD